MSKITQKLSLPKIFMLLLILIIFSSTILLYFYFNLVFAQQIINGNKKTLETSPSPLHPPVIVDPNPNLIDKKSGNLINDINLTYTDHDKRNGTISDGVSKLLLVTSYKNPINFSIVDDANLSKGTLSCLSDN